MTEDQRRRLFEVYYLCHFGRAVALDLCERAARINQLVALLTLAGAAGSLLTGAVALFAIDGLKPYWAVLNIVAVVLAIWAAIMSYSEKEFEYHTLASNFQGIALEVENFSGYAVYGDTFSASEIDRKATAFHAEYSELMGRTRREYKRYSDRHAPRIDAELRQRMQAAGFARETDRPRQSDNTQ
jgi:hypothetical protein